jgi:hypothetical protein
VAHSRRCGHRRRRLHRPRSPPGSSASRNGISASSSAAPRPGTRQLDRYGDQCPLGPGAYYDTSGGHSRHSRPPPALLVRPQPGADPPRPPVG